jgi:P2 family phage contractile tail tube protein
MATTTINKITNANVYMDGRSFFGKAEEATLPPIKYKTADHKALGMIGDLGYAAGLEKMEAKFKWNSLYTDVLRKTANPYTAVDIQLRSSIDVYSGQTRVEQQPLVVYMRGQFSEVPSGNYKSQENADGFENTMSVSYIKLEVAGQTIYEIDVEASIHIVDGVDLLAEYRQNLGI